MEFHEIANIFPLMVGDEYRMLREDIAINGLLEPIVIYQGKILDGRNRYTACVDLSVIPQFVEWNESTSNPLDYVISKNLHRRQLNESQRAAIAAKLANMQFGDNQYKSGSANLQTPSISQAKAAEMMNVSTRSVATVKSIERDAPELLTKIESGEITAHEAEKSIRDRKNKLERQKLAESAKSIPVNDRWHVYHGDIETWVTDKQYDFIITDPPYPKEYLHLYEILAIRANEWLKPGGLLVAMCGQSYVNQIYFAMDTHLEYYWTMAYLTPGDSASLWQKNVIPKWKPLLMYSRKGDKYTGKMFGDVAVSDNNEKSLHKWEQSYSGMLSVIKQICNPGQSILDPFCGSGTTGVAALKHGCLFDGLELLDENVAISRGRLYDAAETGR